MAFLPMVHIDAAKLHVDLCKMSAPEWRGHTSQMPSLAMEQQKNIPPGLHNEDGIDQAKPIDDVSREEFRDGGSIQACAAVNSAAVPASA
jgi:hypothetical protein